MDKKIKQKFKLALKEKKLERTAKDVRDKKEQELEKRLKKVKNRKERNRIESELNILEKIRDKEENFSGEFPEYGDSASYGGTMVRSD